MKTINFRLLASIVVLAAITIAVIPANAQRRNSEDRNTASHARRDDRTRKSTVQKKSTFNNNTRRDSRSTPIGNDRNINRDVKPKRDVLPSRNKNTGTHSVQNSSNRIRNVEPDRRVSSSRNDKRREVATAKERPTTRKAPASNRVYRRDGQSQMNRNKSTREATNERVQKGDLANNRYRGSEERRTSGGTARAKGNSASRARTIYNLDKNDRRYRTNDNYKGSNKYWSGKYRPQNKHLQKDRWNYYRNYDYRKYHHWDHMWENYRWNYNSWMDYYNSYRPYSYKFHKYYYHHPVFGHVIRRFVREPFVFFHNNHRYYCYDGYFFRYHRGIGYVLADIPFGMTFSSLPGDYERVYINGYLYFRVGNLFFEYSDYGFRLVHYPERYFAYRDDFLR